MLSTYFVILNFGGVCLILLILYFVLDDIKCENLVLNCMLFLKSLYMFSNNINSHCTCSCDVQELKRREDALIRCTPLRN